MLFIFYSKFIRCNAFMLFPISFYFKIYDLDGIKAIRVINFNRIIYFDFTCLNYKLCAICTSLHYIYYEIIQSINKLGDRLAHAYVKNYKHPPLLVHTTMEFYSSMICKFFPFYQHKLR